MSIPMELVTCLATAIVMGVVFLAWLDGLMFE